MKKDMLIKKTTFEFVYESNSISLTRPITSLRDEEVFL